MVEAIEGIVIKTSDYQEKSKILQTFTKEHGLIGIFLRGASNYKSNSFSIAQPITHALFSINYNSSGLSSCFNGELLNSFQTLKLDYDKSMYVYHLFELLLKTLEQHQQVSYLYNLLLIVLNKFDKTTDFNQIKLLTCFYELKLLYFVGVAPVLENCVECGNTENIANFDISRGGFICQKCQDFSKKQYSVSMLEALSKLYYNDINEIDYNINDNDLTELRMLISEFYLYHLGVRTNAIKYFK